MFVDTGTIAPGVGSDGYVYDFSGGRLCLDFANTRGGTQDRPREHLHGYADLLAWSQGAGLLDTAGGALLHGRAAAAAAVYARAVALREALFALFAAATRSERVGPAALVTLNAELASALGHARLVPTADPTVDRYSWGWDAEMTLDRPLWLVARSAADVLTSPTLGQVRVCASELCDWLFVDTSKNRSRQWCDMRVCGNRAKVRRYYERQKTGETFRSDPP